MISIQAAIWLFITILFWGWMMVYIFTSYSGGLWSSGKVKGEMGMMGVLALILWAAFTLIWGGIFWW